MRNLGVVRQYEEFTAFRVDPGTIPPGTRLGRYYMHRHGQWIDRVQKFMEVESTALVRYLTSLEWQQLNLQDSAVNLESDVLKSMVVLEAVFEHTRKKLAPHLSSRLDCMFVWPTWELADTFRQHYFPDGVIHHCKVQGEAVELDGGLLPPVIDLSDLSTEAFYAQFHAARLRAEKYWSAQEPPSLTEMLVKGKVVVQKPVTNR